MSIFEEQGTYEFSAGEIAEVAAPLERAEQRARDAENAALRSARKAADVALPEGTAVVSELDGADEVLVLRGLSATQKSRIAADLKAHISGSSDPVLGPQPGELDGQNPLWKCWAASDVTIGFVGRGGKVEKSSVIKSGPADSFAKGLIARSLLAGRINEQRYR